MDKSTYAVRLEQWTKIVQRCTSSGLTRKEWCSQNHIKLKTYYYWQRRVRNNALLISEHKAVPDTCFTEVKFQPLSAGHPVPVEKKQGFQPDIIIHSRTLTIEISNTASDRLLSIIGKVAAYAE